MMVRQVRVVTRSSIHVKFILLIKWHFLFSVFALVQTQSPVLQGKMLVPMATVRTAPAPAQQFPIVTPPLPVQNGAQTGSKVSEHFIGNTGLGTYVHFITATMLKEILSAQLPLPNS